MGQRARRIIKIEYAAVSLFKLGESPLATYLLRHEETNDFRNDDGSGTIEFPFRVLKDALQIAQEWKNSEDIEILEEEITAITQEGKDDADYIEYAIF